MSTTSCFRVINTLEQEHWITRTGHKRGGYRLSVGLLPVLKSLQDRQRVFEAAAGELQAPADRVGLAAKLSAREGDEAVTVLRAWPNGTQALASGA